MSQSNSLYQPALEKAFRENAMRFIRDKATIAFSEYKSDSAIRGILKIGLTKSIFSTEVALPKELKPAVRGVSKKEE